MHAQDAALGRIQNRRGEERAKDAAVGDRERPPLEVGDDNRVIARLDRKSPDRFLDPREAEAVGVAHDRNHQAALGADRHADVVGVVSDDVLTVDPAVDGRERLQGLDRRLHKERHEAEGDAVLRFEAVLILGAQIHDARHVGFIEGRQDGGGLLRLDEPLPDLLADTAHPLASLTRQGPFHGSPGLGRNHRRRLDDRLGGQRWFEAQSRELSEDVSLGDAPMPAGPFNAGGVELALRHDPSNRRRKRIASAGRSGRNAAVRGYGGRTGNRRRRGGRGGVRVDRADGRADLDGLPFLNHDPEHARGRRGDDVARLVGFEFE